MSDPYGIEVRKLQNLIDEVSSGDEYADNSDSEREDRMIVSDHFSETEEEEDIEEINEHNDNEGGDDDDTSARTRDITHKKKMNTFILCWEKWVQVVQNGSTKECWNQITQFGAETSRNRRRGKKKQRLFSILGSYS
ncbi:hypothetical protein JTB14_021242 [Gonioctena quinquepunctata]|nr:hypothetical protein JTB14_021242 [Gonioctena quinquepunctata]